MTYLEIIGKLRSFDGDQAKINEFLQKKENLEALASAMNFLIKESQNIIGFTEQQKATFTADHLARFNELQDFAPNKILEMLKKKPT